MASPRRTTGGVNKSRKSRKSRKPATPRRKGPARARAVKPIARGAAVGKPRPSRTAVAKPRAARAVAPKARDEARELAVAIARVGVEHSALGVEIIEVRGKVDYADYVLVMAGRSDRQVGALVRHITETMQRERGARCLAVEGMPRATWVLMDFADVIVHIFHQDTRGYYDIESLWIDAKRVPVDSRP